MIATLLLFAALTLTTPLLARASAGGTMTVTVKAPTTAAMLLVSADPTITSVMVVNEGSVTAYLGNSSALTAASGTPIYANTRVVLGNITNSLYGITAASTANLRVTVVRGGGSIDMQRLSTTGIANGAANTTIPMSNGSDLVAGNVLIYNLSTAITPNSTATATAAGTLAITSNATGIGSIFRSDGSAWQLLANYSGLATQTDSHTVATTSNTDAHLVAPFAGTLAGVDCSGIDALAASDTNYITFSLTNLGQAGAGTNPMLAATDANTTKTTGGSAISALTKRSLTLNGTGSNLIVAAGDRLRLRSAVTGTLSGTVTGFKCVLRFVRLS